MKKQLFIVAAMMIAASLNAQITMFRDAPNMNSVLFKNKVYDMENKQEEIQGSAYVYENFVNATINDVDGYLKVRYNAYNDDMEIQQNGQVYIIPREARYSEIKLIGHSESIRLEKFEFMNNPYEGYLFVLFSNIEVTLYKKEKVTFRDFEKSRNTYSEERPAAFVPQKPVFFIKVADGAIIEIPKNKKKFIELLPQDKRQKAEIYLSKNKTDFTKEKDLKELFNGVF